MMRAERRAASRQSRLALVPSKPTQVGLEPRHSPPLKGAPPAARQSRLRGSRSVALVHASRVPLAPWSTEMKLDAERGLGSFSRWREKVGSSRRWTASPEIIRSFTFHPSRKTRSVMEN